MNATQVYSDDDSYSPGRYSDDFDSDDGKKARTPKKTSTPKKISNHNYYQEKFRGRGQGLGGMKGHTQGHKRGRGHSRTSEPTDMRKSRENVTSRVLSASRNRINELRNKVEELNIQIRDLQQENKLYKKMQFRQEKAIRVFEDTENDLPSLLDRHNNEVRALREQNRRLKEKFDKTDRYLRDAEDELERVKVKMNKYKEMCEQKDLKERDELSRKLAQAELALDEKEAKLRELQRYTDMLKKNHKHEVAVEAARQKDVKKQLEELVDKNAQLENQLKEKERALDYLNIYSNPQQGRSSRDASPSTSLAVKSSIKASAIPELTPREKAKFYAEKRRMELLKQKDIKEEKERKKREQWEKEEQQKEMNIPSNPLSEFVFGNKDREFDEREEGDKPDEEKRQRRDIENRERQEEEVQRKQREQKTREEREITDRKIRENSEWKELEGKKKKEQDEWEKKEREKREQDEWEKKERKMLEEKKRREEDEQKERKRRESEMKEERERHERKEQERREKEKVEEERRLQLEREKMINDPLLQADRKKKDDLLKKLQAMDEIGSSADPFTPAAPLKKNKEHSRTSGIKDVFDSQSRRGEPKDYSFTTPINNLHQGKPSHEDVTVPYLESHRHKRQTSDDVGGYNPSFGPAKGEITKASSVKPPSVFEADDEPIFKISNTTSSESTTNQDKKSDLLENLFGPREKTAKNTSTKKAEDTYTVLSKDTTHPSNKQTKVTTATNSTTLPWDVNSTSTGAHLSRLDSDKKSAVFGGSNLFEDDLLDNGGKVLPRRHRQLNLNMFSAKPSVMAIDTFDDEIEEFVL